MDGTAATFDEARPDFEGAWRALQPKIDEADYQEYRRHRALTAWKYAMHDAGAKLPTEMPSGQSKCFWGAAIDVQGISEHILAAHMDMR